MQRLPTILSVGIMSAKEIVVCLNGKWQKSDGAVVQDLQIGISEPVSLIPLEPTCSFTLRSVTIGKDYHWQRQEDQTFTGRLSIISEGAELTAVNTLPIEDYLVSVISSEMSATAGLEFLKAAAVISRSWVINMILRKERKEQIKEVRQESGSYITWFDHEDHTLYDVCADDHCQRYQGFTKASNPNVRRAVEETRGQVLTYGNEVCDCRFSKCCGGRMEEFATCWEDTSVPYLQAREDRDPRDGSIFCDTQDKAILSQVLNNYDQETADFYRWTVTYTQEQIARLISRKLERDFGNIVELRPIKRGPSGRICQLLVKGTKRQLIIGKELVIRSALSESHLYSSAFTVEASNPDSQGIPQQFTLHGKGWGHGVGLCQIGAAVMATKGYDYTQILAHYYPGATLTR